MFGFCEGKVNEDRIKFKKLGDIVRGIRIFLKGRKKAKEKMKKFLKKGVDIVKMVWYYNGARYGNGLAREH